jgi:1-deoxy-D-xylulose-5-phosphate synthase
MLHEVFVNYAHVITVEDGCISGGVGSAVLEFMSDHQYHSSVYRLGIPDEFIEHGTQAQLHSDCGFDKVSIANTVLKIQNKLKLVI